MGVRYRHRMLLLVAAVARACDCEEPTGTWLSTPTGEAPPNTWVWLGIVEHVEDLRLLDAESRPVPTGTRDIETARGPVLVLTPDNPLAPGEHTVEACTDAGCSREMEFVVVGDPLEGSPAVPALVEDEREHLSPWSNSCGLTHRVSFDVVGDGDVYLFDLVADGPLGADPEVDDEVAAAAEYPNFWLGSGSCDTQFLEELYAGVGVRVGAYDLAGHWSGWSDPVRVRYGRCAAAPVARRRGWRSCSGWWGSSAVVARSDAAEGLAPGAREARPPPPPLAPMGRARVVDLADRQRLPAGHPKLALGIVVQVGDREPGGSQDQARTPRGITSSRTRR